MTIVELINTIPTWHVQIIQQSKGFWGGKSKKRFVVYVANDELFGSKFYTSVHLDAVDVVEGLQEAIQFVKDEEQRKREDDAKQKTAGKKAKSR